MTPVQFESLPSLLKGKDARIQAKTGSGKTVAFALTVINNLKEKLFRPQSLILCPTRELAQQITEEIRKLSKTISNVKVLALYGGKSEQEQAKSLHHGVHIVVGTPGRVKKMIKTKALQYENITQVVLDEADRMLDMGFKDDLLEIIGHLPNPRQTMLFSATFPEEIKILGNKILNEPVRIKVDSEHQKGIINEFQLAASNELEKSNLVISLLKHFNPETTLIFCNTKQQCKSLNRHLNKFNIDALELHGDLDQSERTLNINKFINHTCSIIIATDVAARGIDIDKLSLVINFDISLESDVHTHRIGRTGRAGSQGMAINLYTPKEKYILDDIYQQLGREVTEIQPNDLQEKEFINQAQMSTLYISIGRKQKIRPGDILGALTNHIEGDLIGKIKIFDTYSYVAINQNKIKSLLKNIKTEKIKGKSFRASIV